MGGNDYDAFRKKNIAERNAIFAEFFGELKQHSKDLEKDSAKDLGKNFEKLGRRKKNADPDYEDEIINDPPKKRRRTSARDDSYSFRVKPTFEKKYNTRSRGKLRKPEDEDENSLDLEDENSSEPSGNGSKLQILFPWAKPAQRSIDLMKLGVCDVDEEEESGYRTRRQSYRVTRSEYDPDTIPPVDEITEEMIANVAEKSTLKEYNKIIGTSCHQCRQKTLDTKTVCRSGECIGVRGQFCGPCLMGRYGESAVKALKDPKWACPPCRGLCNCSICRTRSGLRPTGILAPVVREEGFSSVMDYLNSKELEEP